MWPCLTLRYFHLILRYMCVTYRMLTSYLLIIHVILVLLLMIFFCTRRSIRTCDLRCEVILYYLNQNVFNLNMDDLHCHFFISIEININYILILLFMYKDLNDVAHYGWESLQSGYQTSDLRCEVIPYYLNQNVFKLNMDDFHCHLFSQYRNQYESYLDIVIHV